ncbi:hypothetical protein [Haloferax sp. ATB1]|uniref:hypothetical protein n=1 Tax=Haloferax sp. ATB1 TaxID=1508454 RepID=UPI0032E43166
MSEPAVARRDEEHRERDGRQRRDGQEARERREERHRRDRDRDERVGRRLVDEVATAPEPSPSRRSEAGTVGVWKYVHDWSVERR